jgi:DNA segregation ATPase FtsK/SpoIIIE-like protein
MGDPGFWTWLRWGSIAILGAVMLPFAIRQGYLALRYVRDDLTDYFVQLRRDRLTLAHIARQNELHGIRRLEPDENGRLGVTFDGQIFKNMDTGEAFDQLRTLYLDPMRTQLDAMQRMLIAMRGVHAGSVAKVQGLAEGAMPAIRWPAAVYLDELMKQYGLRLSIDNLVLGVTYDEQGNEHLVTGSMEEMIHILIGAASGYGKSTLEQSLAYQAALSETPCDLALVDYGAVTFGHFAQCKNLLYPIADTPELTVALFRALIAELARRKEMFKAYPGVSSLSQFNQTTGAGLRPIICFCDESSQLFVKDGVKDPLIELTSMARKFGLWIVAAGTDFKATTIPTEASVNFSTRIALRSRPTMSRILIDSRDAMHLKAKGRALALLPGRDQIEIQTPMVRDWSKLPTGGPRQMIDLSSCPGAEQARHSSDRPAAMDGLAEQVEAAWRSMEQPTVTAVTQALFNQDGGRNWSRVKQVVQELGLSGDLSTDRPSM